ncbi:MAG: acetolactate synthase [Opitutales bacterium]
MNAEVARRPGRERIFQFSVFEENKVGRLNDFLLNLAHTGIHVMAICLVDTTDCTITRIVVDYPERLQNVLHEHAIAFTKSEVVAVEIATEEQIKDVTCALTQAEINIYTIYPFLMRPNGRTGLVLRVEDNDLAQTVLQRAGIKVLTQHDVAR